MNKRILALALASAATSPAAFAQLQNGPAPITAPLPAPADNVFFISSGAPVMAVGGTIDVVAGEGAVPGQVVKDKAYSADSVTESTQILGDGNRITHRNEARIFRDSAGRTRREQTLDALGVFQPAGEPIKMITINDPVASVSYLLDPHAKTARELGTFKVAFDANATWTPGAPPPMPPPDAGGANVTAHFERGGAASGQPIAAETFETAVPPPGAGPGVAGLRAGPPPFAMAVSPDATTTRMEDLGEQVLEGVVAHGTRRTQRIAAGAIGNLRAIDVVSEQWYSTDLEAIVLRRNTDPRFGETVYRLVNVVRGEQSPDLFMVPNGYEITKDGRVRVDVRGPAVGSGGSPPGATGAAGRRVLGVPPDAANSAPR